jgi:hypothetical protein
MTREELIEAVIPALGLSYVRHPGYAQGRARRVIDAVEPLIRADMDWHQKANAESAVALMTWRDELHAKVEALPHADDCDYGRFTPDGDADCTCLRADVLALFDGGSDD